MYDAGVRYEDLVGASEAVVTKPGYGIISEAIANDAALLYTSRGHFPEYDVLVEEMPKYLAHRLHQSGRSVRRQVGVASRQAAGAAEDQEEAGDERRGRGGGDPAEGARQAAEEAARTAEGEVLIRLRTCGLRASGVEPEPAQSRSPKSVVRSPLRFHAGHQRPDLRHVHLFNRDRLQVGLREESGQVEI